MPTAQAPTKRRNKHTPFLDASLAAGCCCCIIVTKHHRHQTTGKAHTTNSATLACFATTSCSSFNLQPGHLIAESSTRTSERILSCPIVLVVRCFVVLLFSGEQQRTTTTTKKKWSHHMLHVQQHARTAKHRACKHFKHTALAR